MTHNHIFGVALLCASLTMPATLTLAADITDAQTSNLQSYPYIEGEFIWELQNDYTFDSDDLDAELNDTFAYLELAASIFIAKEFQINFALVGEPVQDAGPSQDRFFDDHGIFVEVLNGQINFSDNTNLILGKFGPGFGTAWDVTPGIYGVDFAEDYELAEFIGFGLNHTFDADGAGSVTLGANIFTADTSALSDSIITRRGQTNLADGGVGNTENLDSFSISLDGEELPELEGFTWHLGYRHLSAGLGDVDDEQGFVAGFIQETSLGDEKSITFNLEYANFDGGANDVDYLTAGLTLSDGPWHADFAGTFRNTDVTGRNDVDDVLFQASVGYVDQHEIDWNVGYRFIEEDGVDNHTLGVFITKAVEISTK